MKRDLAITPSVAFCLFIFAFVVTLLVASRTVAGHEKATCCADPCEVTEPCGPSCEIGVCGTTYENETYHYSPACGGGGENDNCKWANCFLFVSLGTGLPCNVQCCSDDMAICLM